MAIVKQVTLTEKGLSAGPDYEILYSANGINYIALTGSYSLPEIGDSVTVSVADDTQYIKLINLSPTCNENEVVISLVTTTTTTTTTLPPLPTTTTTTTPPGTTTTTTLNPAFTTTTTFASGSQVQVIAHSCQNFYDFQKYNVPSSPSPSIDGVYKDSYGTCYYITSIPVNQSGSVVGNLTYVGPDGSCASSSCVTTTTTVAPYCNKWSVSNATGAGYYFKYYYCGQSEATYLEVPAGQTVTVCTQNDKIYNSFNAPLTFNNLAESCIGTTTTTTLPPDLIRVVAHACQDFYDFNTYGVNQNITPNPQINDVFKDSTGKCYYITSIPTNQSGPVVGTLSYVGGQGSCSSPQCVTTTTTAAPFCTNWKVENPTSAGYYFKYQYCGQTNYIYPEVPANSSVIVCVQNNRIFDSFNTPLAFTQLSTACNATTTTTTTQGPKVLFRAAPCQNIANFNTYQADSASYQLGDVFKDSDGTCYSILSFSGEAAVGNLTFFGGPGSCSSPSCVTTTTTAAPFCNIWKVENLAGAGYYFKYKYCGQNVFSYLEVPAFGTVEVCVQNDQIYNSFNAPLILDNLGTSCIGTTTTTTTLGPKTIFTAAPCDDIADFAVFQADSASYQIGDVFIDDASTCYTILSFNGQVPVGELSYLAPSGSGACGQFPCITTTTTIAPYCNVWQVVNPTAAGYYFKYKYCGQNVFSFPEILPYSTQSFCVQNDEIYDAFGTPLVFTNQSTSCIGTTTTTTTTGPKTIFTAAPCQNISNFNVFQAASASYNIGDVFIDDTNTCYSILSFNGQVPVGELTYLAPSGSCGQAPCVTTTTTASPFCNIWQVVNNTQSAYTFKYKYCGQTDFSYPTVGPNSTQTFCVQNDEIYNAFGAPLTFTNQSTSCVGTTTTTTTTGPKTIFTAAPCNNVSNFSVFQAASASYSVGDVFVDDLNNCYTILSFNGQVPVGELTYLAASGSGACLQFPCVTTTTTIAPFCNLWQITNPYGASYSFKYKYCGQSDYSYPSIGPNSSIIVCVQNDEIYNSFGAPITFDNLEVSCVGTTTTTSTTTTTTLAPGCFLYDVFNYGGGSGQFRYVYCGASVTSSVTLPSQGQTTVCVDNNKIETSYFGITWTRTTGSCAATTTTTSTTSTTTTTTQAPFSNKFSADAWFYANNFAFDVEYTASTLLKSTATISPASGNTILVGGPEFIAFENSVEDSRRSDAHFFILSGSALRTSPTQNPTTPIAKVLNVRNVTSNTVPLNYVDVSGSLIGQTLTSGSTTQITSQTLPFGLDGFVLGGTAWLSASFQSDFTGSVTGYQRGPRFYSLTGVRTVAQQEQIYITPSGSTTPVLSTLGQPVSGSSVTYRCSVTIPFVRNGLYVVNDLGGCGGNTTTTTSTTTTTTAGPAAFSNVWTAEGWYASADALNSQTITYFENRNQLTSSLVTSAMGNTLLLGGPAFSASISSNTGNIRLDAHYFAQSGSSFRTQPYEQVITPKAKVLNVTNITNRTVPLNYVNISGSLVAQSLASGSSATITSQTIPFGYDNTNGSYQYISASIVSDYTGSLTPYPTGSRWYKMTAVASISQNDFLYRIADGSTTGVGEIVTFPVSGSTTFYRCSRTIPNTQKGYYVAEYVTDCPSGTTTTTTAGPTTTTTTLTPPTTTTTTLGPIVANQNVVMASCPDGDITTPITLAVNGPQLQTGNIVKIVGGFADYNCYIITNNSYTGSLIYNATVENVFTNCDDCEGNVTTTTTTLAPTTTTTTGGLTTTTTTTIPPGCRVWNIINNSSYQDYVTLRYCGQSWDSMHLVEANSTASLCVEGGRIFPSYPTWNGEITFSQTTCSVVISPCVTSASFDIALNPFDGGGGYRYQSCAGANIQSCTETSPLSVNINQCFFSESIVPDCQGFYPNMRLENFSYAPDFCPQPTTTTTTYSPLCKTYEAFYSSIKCGVGGSGTLRYVNCVGNSVTQSISSGNGLSSFCAISINPSSFTCLNVNELSPNVCTQTTTSTTSTTTTSTTTTTTTIAPTTTTTTYAPLGTLPSGAVLIYDMGNASSWPGTGSFVYDLSGNRNTGSLYGTVSGSTGALSFLSSTARLECTSSAFNSALTQRKQLYVGVQYQTGSLDRYTSLAATWGNIGTAPDIGYGYFLSATATEQLDSGIQIYASNGTSPSGYYNTAAAGTFATGSVKHTYSMMANIASGSYKIYNDNSLKTTVTGLNTSKFFVYNGNTSTGNGMRFGNRTGTDENFRGNFYKAIVYNRALSDSELNLIEAWMTGSV